MSLLEKIVEGSSVVILGEKYKVLGKGLYVTQKDPETVYAKILLENHHVLVLSPYDGVAYYGKNEGKLSNFDSFAESVEYGGKVYKQSNSDYQILISLEFGSPLEVEGEVEFWDYELDDEIISVAIISRNKMRADVVAKYIQFDDVQVV